MTLLFAFSVAPLATLRALGVLVSGKRVRAWNHLSAMAERYPDYYRYWSKYIAKAHKQRFIGPDYAVSRVAYRALAQASGETLRQCLAQLEGEGYEWVVFHGAEDRVDPDVPAVIARASTIHDGAAILYWDEEWALPGGTLTPWVKPDWSDWLYKARDCLTGSCALNLREAHDVASALGDLPADRFGLASLAQALIARGHKAAHLPLVLTRRLNPAAELEAWAKAAPRLWPEWQFPRRDDAIPFLRALPRDPVSWPRVSVIIPTRDRIDLLRTCLAGLERTCYAGEVEVLIVDNASAEPESLAFFASLAGKVRVIRDDGPFNFSRLNNLASTQANGEFLCLLNNDVEVLGEDWLTAMMRIAVDTSVGAVGAQLLYPDGAIQHAGVAIGMGNAAGHIQRGVDPAATEHCAWHAVSREVTAVTAACLLVSKAHYQVVGGLDEAGFAVAFNDVDFCLKLDAAGLTNVYCAEARLIHAESRTRPDDYRADQVVRFERELALLQSRWQTPGFDDARFSPLLSPSSEICLLRAG
ncbi:MAG: glycosyltransferase family 2 protein [Erythrobacter sp.]